MERISKKGGEGHSELSANFTVSQALKTGGALTQMETAVDIKVDKFRSGTVISYFNSVASRHLVSCGYAC